MTFVALLRSINVGQRQVPMATLREKLSAMGFSDVRTYVQSGNVVFTSPKGKAADVATRIERMLLATFGFEVPTIVRTSDELAAIASAHPFRDGVDDLARLHVTFLSDAPNGDRSASLERLATSGERFRIIGREVCLHVPGSYAETKLSNAAIEKALGVTATTRNFRTVTKLVELSA